ncbi:hypothetical protein LCM20_03035 [Halobacillus litoralis]|uniref:hypothetical protein n=1 Tax=Halobacillus litoralis TaxID=45668 RepID=UPI001CD64386|nr:hypothetical protein [Halobacillus litoralis]MCA0969565.1 hypothetical protein [Halobacillus litoralis]
MSEKKKVIRVKDLVIEAENVFIEPVNDRHHKDHRRDERVDPFFGRRGQQNEESSSKERSDDESSGRKGFWF